MMGADNEKHIFTRVLPGTAPLQEYQEHNPAQVITLDYETEDSDNVDDLSMTPGGFCKEKLQGLLDVAILHQRMATRGGRFGCPSRGHECEAGGGSSYVRVGPHKGIQQNKAQRSS